MVRMPYKDSEYTSQKSTRFYVNKKKKAEGFHSSLYTHMLTEDLRLGIMPIGWQPKRFNFECELKPKSTDVEKLIREGLPTHHGVPHYFTEAICDFVEEATHIVACYGRALYEIIYVFNNKRRDKVKGFQLTNIPNHSIKSFLGFYWQYIPKEAMEYRARERRALQQDEEIEARDKRMVWLPRQCIFALDFPKQLGGTSQLRRMMCDLGWAGQETVPKFYMKDMELQKQQQGYDFSVYRDNQDIFVLKLTKQLGWTARSLSSEKLLEFYTFYRYLKFARTQAILREYIIEKLNNLLIKTGKEIGFNNRIVLKNCISSEELTAGIEKLLKGQLEFTEILNLAKLN